MLKSKNQVFNSFFLTFIFLKICITVMCQNMGFLILYGGINKPTFTGNPSEWFNYSTNSFTVKLQKSLETLPNF